VPTSLKLSSGSLIALMMEAVGTTYSFYDIARGKRTEDSHTRRREKLKYHYANTSFPPQPAFAFLFIYLFISHLSSFSQ
jgi:hypothetical protein